MMFERGKKNQGKLSQAYFLENIAFSTPRQSLKILESTVRGISREEVEKRREKWGENKIDYGQRRYYYILRVFLKSLITPFTIVLAAVLIFNLYVAYIAGSSASLIDYLGIVVVSIMILFSVGVSYIQEYRSMLMLEKLRRSVDINVDVIRVFVKEKKSRLTEEILFKSTESSVDVTSYAQLAQVVSSNELVPGDLIFLSAGDIVPADIRILASKDLFVNQSSLTGETVPVEKFSFLTPLNKRRVAQVADISNRLLKLDNVCLGGTNVSSGIGVGVVVLTGNRTFSGRILEFVSKTGKELSKFEKEVRRVSWFLFFLALSLIALIFILRLSLHWKEMKIGEIRNLLIFAAAIVVGLVPEMLPGVVASILNSTVRKCEKRGIFFKNFSAVQNLGSIETICVDKTGTITENKVRLVRYLNVNEKSDLNVLKLAYLNSNYQTGLRNIIDKAIIEFGREEIKVEEVEKLLVWKKIDEVPFDFVKRKMSVIMQHSQTKERMLVCKGATKDVVKACEWVRSSDEKKEKVIIPFDDQAKIKAFQVADRLNEKGFRVVAIATKEVDEKRVTVQYSAQDESQMILEGYVAFFDPPKKSAKDALELLAKHGIGVKILTGDGFLVTKLVCEKLDISTTGHISGYDIDSYSDDHLTQLIRETGVFTDMNPIQKARVVRLIKEGGTSVGFLGDGSNDAIAMHFSDVGISVKNATDISKETSGIILGRKDLAILDYAIVNSRKSVANISKYIKIAFSSNFGNIFSVIVATTWLSFLPMLPVQLLIQNLLYDLSQLTVANDNVDSYLIEKPRSLDAKELVTFMFFNGPVSSVFDVIFFVSVWNIMGGFISSSDQLQFQTGWFLFSVITQSLIFHILRTKKVPFFQSRSSISVQIASFAGITFSFALVYLLPLYVSFGFGWIDSKYLVLIGALSIFYAIVAHIFKLFYCKWFEKNLL